MSGGIGPLVPADELLSHQIADTFAVVGSSDLSWTERVCAMAAATDGSLQVAFGLGRYPNRDVLDAYAGVSLRREQVTVRASRRLGRDQASAAGPIRYEIVEALRAVRFVLEPHGDGALAFDWTFEGIVPPAFEERAHVRQGPRIVSDLVRYHHIGVASGWVELDGVRHDIGPDTWVSTRDHSWGTRLDVGRPVEDLRPRPSHPQVGFQMIWCPVAMRRPDGSRYGLFLHYQIAEAPGFVHKQVAGGVEEADGQRTPWTDLSPELTFDPVNRRLIGGTVHATTADGATRPIAVEAVGDTGFHLGAGLYFGFDGHHHGEWRGDLVVEGERIADCTDPAEARRLHQLRDTVVHVRDPVGGGEGFGNCQPIVTGPHAASGLGAEDSFI